MFNCSGKILLPRVSVEVLNIGKNTLSSHAKSPIFQKAVHKYSTFRKWTAPCACKYFNLETIRYNSNSGNPKRQKVVVAFQNSELCQNSKLYPSVVPLGKISKAIDKHVQKDTGIDITLKHKYKEILANIEPYVKLMRIDKPIGTWLLFWPGGWSIMLAADPHLASLGFVMKNLGLFLTGAFVMRGAGCTINDMWDRDIDGKVARTKSRPLVSGQISMKKATLFLGAQLSVGLAILFQLNWYSVILGASSMGLVVLYPLAKRITDYPQLVLGLTFNWGALLGWTAVRGSFDPFICLPLYAAGICWTLLYDTIYAHQDKKDDMMIGIKSTALKFNENTKSWLWANGVGVMAGLGTVGAFTEMQWPYYASLGVVGTHIARQIWTLKPDNPEDCSSKFISNSKVGLFIFLGIIFGKWDTLKEYVKGTVVKGQNVIIEEVV